MENAITGLIFVLCGFIGAITPPLIYMILQKTTAYKEMMKAESELMKARTKNEQKKNT